MKKVQVRRLRKTFPKRNFLPVFNQERKKVLKNINLTVNKGEIFGIVGPNGAGKTTLIKIIAGLIYPTSGNVWVNGYNIVKDEYEVKNKIGLVTGHERSFYWRLTGKQNLQFFGKLYEMSSAQIDERIDCLVDFLSIEEELDKRFQKCSSGFKQRLSIARGLLHEPDLLIMDEPTQSLDPSAAKKLREFIKQNLVIQQRKTILFATHNLSEAEFLANRIALLHKGMILKCGSAENLKESIGDKEASLEEVFHYYTK